MPNFAKAWLWAANHRQWDLLSVTLAPLRLFLTESGRFGEGRSLFGQVATALRGDPSGPQGLLAALLEALGRFHAMSGHPGEARAHLDEALLISSDEEPNARALVLQSLGTLQLATGEADEAAASYRAGIELVADTPSALAASLRYDLAQTYHFRGERALAVSAAREALRAARSADDQRRMTMSYLLLADIEVELDPDRAIVLLHEGWVIAKQESLDSLAIFFPHIPGLARLKLGEAESAEKYFSEGLAAANDVGRPHMVCANHVGRAEARLLRNDLTNAKDDLRTGIRLALKVDFGRSLMWAAVVSCRTAAEVARLPDPQITELLRLILQHPASDQEAKDKAIETLGALFKESWLTEDEAISLDEVAERALQLLMLS